MILDAKGAIGLLRLVVFEKGADFVYEKVDFDGAHIPRCVNFHEGEPSCIVGHVLANLGVSAEDAARMGVDGNMSAINVAGNLERFGYEWKIDSDAVDILTAAQIRQDNGQSWGEALAYAENLFGSL